MKQLSSIFKKIGRASKTDEKDDKPHPKQEDKPQPKIEEEIEPK